MKLRHIAFVSLFLLAASAAASSLATNTGEQFVTFAGFRLLRGTLLDVQGKLGDATEVVTGDAGELRDTICYRTPEGHALFLAGEMHWNERRLSAFGLERDDISRPCKEFPADKAPVKLEIGGIRLGMTKADLERVVGQQMKWQGDDGFVEIDSTGPITPAYVATLPENVQNEVKNDKSITHLDIEISIISKFDGDKLKYVEIWKSETF